LLTGRKLLLADDSLTIQKVVSLTFGDEGMEVIAVSNGDEALKQLDVFAPDIVLADVHMPEPNGYRVCEHVKRDARLRDTPVLLLVGTFEPFNEAEARRVGADDVLTKPFQSIRELVSKVGQLLSGRKEEQPTDKPSARAETADTEHEAPVAAAPVSAAQEPSAPPTFTWPRPAQEPTPARQTWPPAPEAHAASYNDFDMDDQTIQTTPAERFGGQLSTSEGDSEQMVHEVGSASNWAQARAGEEELVVLDEPEAAPAEAIGAQRAPELSYAGRAAHTASESAPHEVQNFATDDTLLDLGESETSMSAPNAPADEFILDLGEAFAPAPAVADVAEAPRVMYAEGLASSPAEASEPLVTEEAPHTDAHALEADAQAYEQPPQSGQAVELVLPETTAAEPPREVAVSTASDAAIAAPGAHEPEAQATTQPEMPAPAVSVAASSAVSVEPSGATQLSPEMIEVIARRVVELMSDKVVREVAWEVVPDLAERLIKQRLQEEHAQETR
jgi:CheY-like chemotaxis protein